MSRAESFYLWATSSFSRRHSTTFPGCSPDRRSFSISFDMGGLCCHHRRLVGNQFFASYPIYLGISQRESSMETRIISTTEQDTSRITALSARVFEWISLLYPVCVWWLPGLRMDQINYRSPLGGRWMTATMFKRGLGSSKMTTLVDYFSATPFWMLCGSQTDVLPPGLDGMWWNIDAGRYILIRFNYLRTRHTIYRFA